LKNELHPAAKKNWLISGAITALCLTAFVNEYFTYFLLTTFTNFTYSINFFPPEISLVSVRLQNSISLFVFMLHDLVIILLEIEFFLMLSKTINPPYKFGLLSLLLALIGILLIKFIYKAVILVFAEKAGEANISLLYLFYSRQQVLIFMFFTFLLTFGYLTYVINRIKTLLENFPKGEENAVTQK